MKNVIEAKQISLGQFYQELKDHDWFYSFCDCGDTWRKGKNNHNRLKRISELNPRFRELYDQFIKWANACIQGLESPYPEPPEDDLEIILSETAI